MSTSTAIQGLDKLHVIPLVSGFLTTLPLFLHLNLKRIYPNVAFLLIDVASITLLEMDKRRKQCKQFGNYSTSPENHVDENVVVVNIFPVF